MKNPMDSYPLPLWMEMIKLAPNTSIARRWIVEGSVFVNGERATSIAQEVQTHDTVEVIKS